MKHTNSQYLPASRPAAPAPELHEDDLEVCSCGHPRSQHACRRGRCSGGCQPRCKEFWAHEHDSV